MGNTKDSEYWRALADKGYKTSLIFKGPPAKRENNILVPSFSSTIEGPSAGMALNNFPRNQRLPLRMVVSEPAVRKCDSLCSNENSYNVESLLANPVKMAPRAIYNLSELKKRNVVSSTIRTWLNDPCSRNYRTTKPTEEKSNLRPQCPEQKHLKPQDKYEDFNRAFQPSLSNEQTEEMEHVSRVTCEDFVDHLQGFDLFQASNPKETIQSSCRKYNDFFAEQETASYGSFLPTVSDMNIVRNEKFQPSQLQCNIFQRRHEAFQPSPIHKRNQSINYYSVLDEQRQFTSNRTHDSKCQPSVFDKEDDWLNMVRGIFPFHRESQNYDDEENTHLHNQESFNDRTESQIAPNSSCFKEEFSPSPEETEEYHELNSLPNKEDTPTSQNFFNFSLSEGQERSLFFEQLRSPSATSKCSEDNEFVWNPASSQNTERITFAKQAEEKIDTASYSISPDIFSGSSQSSLESLQPSAASDDLEIDKDSNASSPSSSSSSEIMESLQS